MSNQTIDVVCSAGESADHCAQRQNACKTLEGLQHQVQSLDRLDPTGDAHSPEIQDLESSIGKTQGTLEDLEDYEKTLKDGDEPGSPADQIAALKKAVDAELAKAIKDPTAKPNDPGAFKTALANYQRAIGLVLQAEATVGGRALDERHRILESFVKSPLPTHANGNASKGYAQLSEELDKVQTAVQGLIGKEETPDNPVSATEVTSEITRNIVTYRRDTKLDSDTRDALIRLAKARVLYGRAEAVIITDPTDEQLLPKLPSPSTETGAPQS